MPSRFLRHFALLVLWVAVVAVCVSWLVIVLFQGDADADSDYLWQPLEIDNGLRSAVGLAATSAAVGISVLLLRWSAKGAMSRSWVAAFIAGGAIAAYAGVTYGAATAPVIGANIGGGGMLLFAGPFVVATVVVTIAILRCGRGPAG